MLFACLPSGLGFSVLRGTATKCSLEPEGEKVVDPSGTWASQRGLPAGERGSSCPGDADTAVGGRKAAVGGNKSITCFGSKSL